MQDNALIDVPEVCRRLGGVSRETLYQWRKNPALQFPKPVKINSRILWRPVDLERWTETRIERTA